MYANLQQLHNPEDADISPPTTPGNYLKTLLDVWDMYIDPDTNRLYYINKETNERTYKPPRHPNKEKQVL